MTRIYPDYTYGSGPREGCWWDETCHASTCTALHGNVQTEIAIVGAGFTGLCAALHLAEAGHEVVVLDAETPGWGASGRNGGFCCIGGSKITDRALDKRFGPKERLIYRRTEAAAVGFVANLLARLRIKVDTHSNGETVVAHRPKDYEAFKRDANDVAKTHNVDPILIPESDLDAVGMAGPFYGAMTIPIGFGLNPRKYALGLVDGVSAAGGQIYGHSCVSSIAKNGDRYQLATPGGTVIARQVIVATNGYGSETVPDAIRGRYLPTQSNVLVTRPLTDQEIAAAGWSTDQMAYDTRNLLHYFRLLPDKRFLFGMRGGLISGPNAEVRSRAMVRRDFEKMFPAWKHVESPNAWSGLVCVTRDGLPFAGRLGQHDRLFAGFGYHGNGVAMGSYAGALLADLVSDNEAQLLPIPLAMSAQPATFPLGRFRRALLPPVYALKYLSDA